MFRVQARINEQEIKGKHGHKTMKNGNEIATGLNLTCRRNVTQREHIFELLGESLTNSEQ